MEEILRIERGAFIGQMNILGERGQSWGGMGDEEKWEPVEGGETLQEGEGYGPSILLNAHQPFPQLLIQALPTEVSEILWQPSLPQHTSRSPSWAMARKLRITPMMVMRFSTLSAPEGKEEY